MATIVTSENKAEFVKKKLAEKGKKQRYTEHGLPINEKGHVRLWHGTSKEAAEKIVKEKMLRSAGEPDVYLTTHPKEAGYGTHYVGVDVPHHMIELDDEFPSGRMDFRVNAKNKMFAVENPKIEKSPNEK